MPTIHLVPARFAGEQSVPVVPEALAERLTSYYAACSYGQWRPEVVITAPVQLTGKGAASYPSATLWRMHAEACAALGLTSGPRLDQDRVVVCTSNAGRFGWGGKGIWGRGFAHVQGATIGAYGIIHEIGHTLGSARIAGLHSGTYGATKCNPTADSGCPMGYNSRSVMNSRILPHYGPAKKLDIGWLGGAVADAGRGQTVRLWAYESATGPVRAMRLAPTYVGPEHDSRTRTWQPWLRLITIGSNPGVQLTASTSGVNCYSVTIRSNITGLFRFTPGGFGVRKVGEGVDGDGAYVDLEITEL